MLESGEVFLSYFGIIWVDREGCSRRWAPAAHGKTRQIRIYNFFSVLFHFPFYSDIAEIALCSG